MLVLTRKAEESVVIGGPGTPQPLLTVTVLAIERGKVRLGFRGDASVPVHRWEVWQRMQPPEQRRVPQGGQAMPVDPVPHRLRAVAFDVDAASLRSLREALPGWEIRLVAGAKTASLCHDWNGGADLFVVTAQEEVAETLGLCRFLARCSVFSANSRQGAAETAGPDGGRPGQAGRQDVPLLVLVGPGQEPLVRAALEAGANGCLVLPIHAREWARTLARVWQGNRPGRHTLDLDRAQHEDLWRDDGGQG
jgi:carbon storage regulator CsrA